MTDSLLLSLLPEVIATSASTSAPLRALAAAADDLHAPVHRMLDRIDSVVDPYRTPDALVPYLASWVDLGWLSVQPAAAGSGAAGSGVAVSSVAVSSATVSGPAGTAALGVSAARLRDLMAAAADLSARRGTPAGLCRFLHLATGCDGFEVMDGGRDFHVLVRVPTEAADSVELVEHIVAMLKPAHVTSEVELESPGGEPDA